MNHPPALRLRRDRQPRLIGNVLAIAIFATIAATVLARGVMPGPTDLPQAPGVAVVNPGPCTPDPVLPDPSC